MANSVLDCLRTFLFLLTEWDVFRYEQSGRQADDVGFFASGVEVDVLCKMQQTLVYIQTWLVGGEYNQEQIRLLLRFSGQVEIFRRHVENKFPGAIRDD